MINNNGTITSEKDFQLEAHNRGLNYGDAIFETLKISAGKINFWEDHYFRLMASMRLLRMEIPMSFTQEYLEEQVFNTLNASNITGAARVKIIVYRKSGGFYTPHTNEVDFHITCTALEEDFYQINKEAVEVELFKDHYITSGLLSTLKTNNKITNVLGSIFAQENGYQNCFLINERKQVVEALNGNIFLVKGDRIKTPPLNDGCLNGIMRKQILKICAQIPDILIDEESISPFDLQKADELFITNVIQGIVPITKYRKKEFVATTASSLIGKLNAQVRLVK